MHLLLQNQPRYSGFKRSEFSLPLETTTQPNRKNLTKNLRLENVVTLIMIL
jgi:hypothetical protein